MIKRGSFTDDPLGSGLALARRYPTHRLRPLAHRNGPLGLRPMEDMVTPKESPEWNTEDAIEAVEAVIADNTEETQVSDEDCKRLAKLIVQRLEHGP